MELTSGREDGTFGPDEALTRWRALLFMEKLYDQVPKAEASAGFTSGDLMVVLHAIGAAAISPKTPEQGEPATRWLPRGDQGRTAAGRCAHLINDGLYEWEECARGGSRDPVLGRAAMQPRTRSASKRASRCGR